MGAQPPSPPPAPGRCLAWGPTGAMPVVLAPCAPCSPGPSPAKEPGPLPPAGPSWRGLGPGRPGGAGAQGRGIVAPRNQGVKTFIWLVTDGTK